MSLKEKIDFLLKYPSFPIKLINLHRTLKKLKTKKQVWIFQCDFKGHYPYLKPYWEHAKKTDSVEIFFCFAPSDHEKPTKFLIENGISPDRILEPIDLVTFTNWDVYISPTEWGNFFPKNKDAIRAQIFHTLADKGLEYSEELLKFNTIFANGPLHHEFLDKYVFSKYPDAKKQIKVCNVGYAKVDDLFSNQISIDQIKEQFKISPDDKRKIVLYAPNWEAGSALRTYGEDVFKELSQMDNYLVIIKLHYMSLLDPTWEHATGGVDWKSILIKYSKHSNIRIAENTNINSCLRVADLMLTDYGGASLEFLTMDKPIVYLDCPGFFDDRGHDVFENKARNTGYIIDNVLNIKTTINSALTEENSDHKEKRRELSSIMLYNQGKAASIGFDTLFNLALNRNNQ
jgi:hypothetical protein